MAKFQVYVNFLRVTTIEVDVEGLTPDEIEEVAISQAKEEGQISDRSRITVVRLAGEEASNSGQ